MGEGARLEVHSPQGPVDRGETDGADGIEDVVGEGTAAVRGCYGRQRQNPDFGGLDPADQVACVQSAHAVGNDIDAASGHLVFDVAAQFGGALLDAGRRGHGCRHDRRAVACQGFCDTAPVLDSGEEVACKMEFVEAQETVGQDNGVSRCKAAGTDGGIGVGYPRGQGIM